MYAAVGIILLVAGSILAFAIDREADGVDLVTVGWILIAGGGLSLLIGAIQGAGLMSTTRSTTRTERHQSPDGTYSVEDTETR